MSAKKLSVMSLSSIEGEGVLEQRMSSVDCKDGGLMSEDDKIRSGSEGHPPIGMEEKSNGGEKGVGWPRARSRVEIREAEAGAGTGRSNKSGGNTE